MVLVMFCLLSVVIRVLQRKNVNLQFTKIDCMLLMLYAYMSITIIYAADTGLALHLVVGLMVLLASFFIVKIYAAPLSVEKLRDTLVLASKFFFLSCFAWYLVGCAAYYLFNVSLMAIPENEAVSYLYGIYIEGGNMPRFRGICDSPNNFGMYSVLFLPILFAYDRRLPIYLYVVIFSSIIATISTTTYLAFFIMLFVLMLSSFSKLNFKKIISIILIGVMFSIFLGIAFVIFEHSASLMNGINNIIDARVARIETGSGRWELWEFTFGLVKDSPIVGYGLNQSRELLLPLRALKSTHNNILELLIEGGAIALFFYISLLITCLLCIFKVKNNSDREWMLYAFIGEFIFSNANVTVYNDSFVLMLGLISAFIVKLNLSKNYIGNGEYIFDNSHA